MKTENEEQFYLLDLERAIGIGRTFYWKPFKYGYTTLLDEAALFSREEAEQIVNADFDKRTIMVSQKTVERILKQ